MNPPLNQRPATPPAALQAPEAYLRLLDAVAHTTRTELTFEERRQDGYFGLHHALTHFDPAKMRTSFEGYAVKCIQGSILNRTAAFARTIRAPARVFRKGEAPRCLSLDTSGSNADPNIALQLLAPEPDLHQPTDEHVAVLKALDQLSAREQQTLRMRFGFEDGAGAKLDQIAAVLGLTREGARVVQERALAKLRKLLRYKAKPLRSL